MKKNTEIRKKTEFNFSNDVEDKTWEDIDFRNEEISRECLERVFELDKVFYNH